MKRALKRIAWPILLLAALGWSWTAIMGDTPPLSIAATNVILISWDGTQRAHLLDLYDSSLLPNLSSLAQAGTYVSMTITDHATDTKAGHSEMLTGLGPSVTGVYSNGRFQAIPTGLTLFERLKSHFGGDGIATAAITGKRGNLYQILENALPAIDQASIRDAKASVAGPEMLKVLEAYHDRPFFAFFHFSDPDSAGHGYGENSREYTQAIRTCDDWLGEIMAKMRTLGIDGRTRVYVTTDHGFDEGSRTHNNAPATWFVTNDAGASAPQGEDADQKDIAPTLLARFGVDLSTLVPALPGQSLLAPAAAAPTLERDLVYATVDGHDLTLDLYRPGTSGLHPAIVFVHGGGWSSGDKATFADYALFFAERGYVGISVNYRLAPEHPFPAAVEDTKAAVRWLREDAEKYGVDPDRIGAMGSSAGGHLVAMLGVTDPSDGLEGSSGDLALSSRVQAVVDYFGPSDLSLVGNLPDPAILAFIGGMCGEQQARCQAASPVTYVSPDDPPFLIVHGTADLRVPFSQSVVLRDALARAGVEATLLALEGAGHGLWPIDSAYGTRALTAALGFFDRHLKALSSAFVPWVPAETSALAPLRI